MACYLVILFQQSSLINKEDLSPGKCFLSSVNTWLIIFILICFYNKQYKTLSMTGFIIPFGCNLVSHPLFFFFFLSIPLPFTGPALPLVSLGEGSLSSLLFPCVYTWIFPPKSPQHPLISHCYFLPVLCIILRFGLLGLE